MRSSGGLISDISKALSKSREYCSYYGVMKVTAVPFVPALPVLPIL
jgi:hypothetical protein